ncbi:sensor histidine kinase [Flavobacterium sp. GB2R13]|uniref:sensor histidine kinase n=1 Tax=Flavobacterium algoris TaxID=3398733 RepID=UPI003A8C7BCB
MSKLKIIFLSYFFYSVLFSQTRQHEIDNLKGLFKTEQQDSTGILILKTRMKLKLAKYNRVHNTYAKTEIADLIFKKKEKSNELIEKRICFNILLFLFLIALSVLFFVIYCLYRNKLLLTAVQEKKMNLEDSNMLIANSLNEKEILLKEIHHRVKNNLQLVISLLNIQARQGGSNTIDDFMEKGESRIAVMALIHENLYQTNNLEKVNYQKYLENLIENILTINDKKNFSVAINTEKIFLDIQTSVSLGLIINELFSNALKHAFPGSMVGKVTINLKQLGNGNYELLFCDNGIGVNFSKKSKKSLGLTLVHLLVEQLEATLTSESISGTAYQINFKQVV